MRMKKKRREAGGMEGVCPFHRVRGERSVQSLNVWVTGLVPLQNGALQQNTVIRERYYNVQCPIAHNVLRK